MANISAESTAKPAVMPKIDLDQVLKSPYFIPGLAVLIGIACCFFKLFMKLPDLWFNEEGYYSHGVLVPVISGYIIYRTWPEIKDRPIKPSWAALPLLLLTGWLLVAGMRAMQFQIVSFALVMALSFGTAFVAGWRWFTALIGPTIYLLFMLPVWTGVIDNYTNPLQLMSTQVAFMMLQVLGFQPFRDASTTVIQLNNFTLDVGVPCSGLKLAIAVTAFTCFFVMVGKLKMIGNILMFAAIIPLCLFINGLRIALIGVVGERYGSDAGHQFHDYSGYIVLVVCFFLLFKLARLLGWKD